LSRSGAGSFPAGGRAGGEICGGRRTECTVLGPAPMWCRGRDRGATVARGLVAVRTTASGSGVDGFRFGVEVAPRSGQDRDTGLRMVFASGAAVRIETRPRQEAVRTAWFGKMYGRPSPVALAVGFGARPRHRVGDRPPRPARRTMRTALASGTAITIESSRHRVDDHSHRSIPRTMRAAFTSRAAIRIET
jgi:hypothetical protein